MKEKRWREMNKCKLVLVKLFSKFIYLELEQIFTYFHSSSFSFATRHIHSDVFNKKKGNCLCKENLITIFSRMSCTEKYIFFFLLFSGTFFFLLFYQNVRGRCKTTSH